MASLKAVFRSYLPPKSVRVVQCIETICIVGDGVDNPVRDLIQYWTPDGKILAERDTLDDGGHDAS